MTFHLSCAVVAVVAVVVTVVAVGQFPRMPSRSLHWLQNLWWGPVGKSRSLGVSGRRVESQQIEERQRWPIQGPRSLWKRILAT